MNADQLHQEILDELEDPAYLVIAEEIAAREALFEEGDHRNCHRTISRYSVEVQKLKLSLDLADRLADVVSAELSHEYYNHPIQGALRDYRATRTIQP